MRVKLTSCFKPLSLCLVLTAASAFSASAQSGTVDGGESSCTARSSSGSGAQPASAYILERNHQTSGAGSRCSTGVVALDAYAQSHAGTYLVFTAKDGVHRLDDPRRIAAVVALFEPMRGLGKAQQALGRNQQVLGSQQQRLGAQQAALAERMVAAPPQQQSELGAGMSQLGATQSDLGAAQSELGRQQSEFGRQQSLAAQRMEAGVRSAIADCMQAGACPVVEAR